MVNVNLHFRGVGNKQRTMPTVGSYLYGPGDERRLWLVEHMLFDNGTVNLYVIEVSVGLAAEMTAEWSAWCDTTADAAKEFEDRGLDKALIHR